VAGHGQLKSLPKDANFGKMPSYQSYNLKEKGMEFLPITKDGVRVYAGFWKRLKSFFVDALICVPISFIFIWMKGFDRTLAIVITIALSILSAMYGVYFNAQFGGTPGKLATGIRITHPNGSRIGWIEAWKRESVNCVFVFLYLVFEVWALIHVDPMKFSSLRGIERSQLLHQHQPFWVFCNNVFSPVWILSDAVVFLFNKRKRAIHDFIAGTVVIRKQFAEPNATGDISQPVLT
jgi:uncharacterized RDD family membrane protein YckC